MFLCALFRFFADFFGLFGDKGVGVVGYAAVLKADYPCGIHFCKLGIVGDHYDKAVLGNFL